MSNWRSLQLFAALPALLLFLGLAAPVQAQRAHLLTDEQAREAAEQALSKAAAISNNQPLKIYRRADLEQFLWTVEEKKPVRDVYFYEVQSSPRRASDASSVWVVAVAGSTREVYQLYGSESQRGANETAQEFNRLISQLALTVPKEKAASFARFFLGSCAGEEPEEIMLDEERLRHAVERYYFGAYGAVWRALEAYGMWWKGFQTTVSPVEPSISLENGRYRVLLKRLLIGGGRHPQVQEWDLEISPRGEVSVLAIQPIFPKEPRWMFYDSP